MIRSCRLDAFSGLDAFEEGHVKDARILPLMLSTAAARVVHNCIGAQ